MKMDGKQCRAIIASYRERSADGQPVPEHTPAYTLDRQIVKARADMGIKRWNELEAEWLS